MKQIILLIIAGLVVAGCCSTRNDFQHLSTSDLQLRRYELKLLPEHGAHELGQATVEEQRL